MRRLVVLVALLAPLLLGVWPGPRWPKGPWPGSTEELWGTWTTPGVFSIAFFNDHGEQPAASLQLALNQVIADQSVAGRRMRGAHHSGDWPQSSPARADSLTVFRAIPWPLNWTINFAHFDGNNPSGNCPSDICDSAPLRAANGGVGLGRTFGGPACRSFPFLEVANPPETRSDLDAWHVVCGYPYLDAGIFVYSVPYLSDNSAAIDRVLTSLESGWPDWPILVHSHHLIGNGGQVGGVDRFDRSEIAAACVAARIDIRQLVIEDHPNVVALMSSHCPTTERCTSKLNGNGWEVIGCAADWFGHSGEGDHGAYQAVEIDCPNDEIRVRTVDAQNNDTGGHNPGCTYPPDPGDAEVDLINADCCDYVAPYGTPDGPPGTECTPMYTFPDVDLQERGMC